MNNENKKKSLFKKMDVEQRFGLMRMAVAILIGLGLAVVLILVSAEDPIESLKYFFLGPLEILNPKIAKALSLNYLDFWVQALIPLLFTGSAIAIMFSGMKINLALEGAILMGGLACAWVCCLLDGDITAPNANPLLCAILGSLAGILAGIVVMVIPALLEKRFGASVMVTSLMINYVCLYISQYCLFSTGLRDPKTSKYGYSWTENTVLTFRKFLGTNMTFRAGLIIALVVVLLSYLFLFKTKWGFKIRQIGANPNFALYTGVGVISLGLIVQLIGGAIGGLCGSTLMLGNSTYYYGIEMTGFGWDGITIAIIANNNPKKVIPAALFIAYIRTGALIMATQPGGPISNVTDIVEGVIVLFLLAEQFLSRTHRKMIVADAKEKQAMKLAQQEAAK